MNTRLRYVSFYYILRSCLVNLTLIATKLKFRFVKAGFTIDLYIDCVDRQMTKFCNYNETGQVIIVIIIELKF